MKKNCIFILMSVILCGCSYNDASTDKVENDLDNQIEIDLDKENIDEEVSEITDSIYSVLDTHYDFEKYEAVEIRKISKDLYLVTLQEGEDVLAYKIYNVYNVLSADSYLLDDIDQTIDQIQIVNDNIIFIANGMNTWNSNREIPDIYTWDINTHQMTISEKIYQLGNLRKSISINNNLNYSILNELSEEDNQLRFKFDALEDTVFAGDILAPNIEILSNEDNNIKLDIENIIYPSDLINKAKSLKDIDDILVYDYKDIANVNHTVIDIKLINQKYFEVTLETGDNIISDLCIKFK